MQQRAAPIIGLVDAQGSAATTATTTGREGEGRPRGLGGDAVLAAGEPLAVAAVAEAGARLGRRVVQRDRVAHRAAVAAAGEEDGDGGRGRGPSSRFWRLFFLDVGVVWYLASNIMTIFKSLGIGSD